MANHRKNIFRNALDAFIAARERQAGNYVAGALLALDDKTLAEHGYSRAELKARQTAFYI